MLHEPKEKRQVAFVDPLFIECEDEIAGIGVQKIIGILNPFGNSFQGKNVAKIIVAKKVSKVRLVDFGIDSHGAPARLNARGRAAARFGVSHPNAGGQTLACYRFRSGCSSALSVRKPRAGSYAETRSRFLSVSPTTAWGSGWITPQDTISLIASSGLMGSSMTSRDGRKK